MKHLATYEIDGYEFETLEGFYDEVSRIMIPGASWGRNLDAFNDILRGGFGTPQEGFLLRWKNHRVSMDRLGHTETVRQLELRLERCHPTNRRQVASELKRARKAKGPTAFDWLIEILQIHGPGGAESGDKVTVELV